MKRIGWLTGICLLLWSAPMCAAELSDVSVERARQAWAWTMEAISAEIPAEMGIPEPVLKAVYVILVPENLSDTPEAVQEAFSSFAEIYVLEHSYLPVGPILDSRFTAVGFSALGVPAACVPPFQIASRIFNYDFLAGFVVTELSVERIRE